MEEQEGDLSFLEGQMEISLMAKQMRECRKRSKGIFAQHSDREAYGFGSILTIMCDCGFGQKCTREKAIGPQTSACPFGM